MITAYEPYPDLWEDQYTTRNHEVRSMKGWRNATRNHHRHIRAGRIHPVMKEVPAEICNDCGEDFVDESVARDIMAMAEKISLSGAQIDVRRYVPDP